MLISVLHLPAAHIHAQDASPQETQVYFLGFEDTEGDGVNTDSDPAGVFTLGPDFQPRRLSSPADRVISMLVSPDGSQLAYLANDGGATVLRSLNLDDGDAAVPRSFETGIQRFSRLEQVLLDRLYVSGWNESSETVLVECTDECHPLLTLFNDSILRFHPSLPYLLVENAAGITVYTLDPFGEVASLVPSAMATGASWSPAAPILAYLTESGELGWFDAGTSEAGSIPIAEVSFLPQAVNWSRTGRYVQVSGPPAAGMENDQPIVLVDPRQQQIITVASPGTVLTSLDWSPADRYLLVDESIAIGNLTQAQYRLYDMEHRSFALTSEAAIGFLSPADSRWSPDGDELAIVGRSRLDDNSGVYIVAMASGALETLYNGADDSIAQTTIMWLNEQQLLLIMPTTSELENLRGISRMLAVLDRESGVLTRLTPNSLTVVPLGLQVNHPDQ